uniref:Uncharacterized protein n=1 Tax=Rhipicephalus zambeziensis TaxID=60191 RepID=A0A224YHQ2_9ACAR
MLATGHSVCVDIVLPHVLIFTCLLTFKRANTLFHLLNILVVLPQYKKFASHQAFQNSLHYLQTAFEGGLSFFFNEYCFSCDEKSKALYKNKLNKVKSKPLLTAHCRNGFCVYCTLCCLIGCRRTFVHSSVVCTHQLRSSRVQQL